MVGIALLAIANVAQAEALTEIIVKANRFSSFRGDTVFSAIDFNQTQVDRGASLDQSLKLYTQAALFRRSSSLTANPTVQGIVLRAIAPSGAGRALVTLDGIPQNDSFGGWVIWAALPQDAISHIHVVRGAGGGAYGGGALTGVIDLSLTPPTDVSEYGTFAIGDSGNERVALGLGGGGLGLHYSAAVIRGDAPILVPRRGVADTGTYGRDQSALGNWQKHMCMFDNCGELAILAGSYASRRDTGLSGAIAVAAGDQYSFSFTVPPSSQNNGYRLQVWHQDSNLSNRSVSVAADRSSTTLANDQIATPASGDGISWAIRHQSTRSEWEIGIDGRQSSGESREFYKYVFGAATRYRVAGGTSSLVGLYGENTQAIGPWTLTGALRIDQWHAFSAHRIERDTTSQSVVLNLSPANRTQTIGSARMGIAYTLDAQMALRLAAYSGFRPPSLNEQYRPFRVGNDVTEANADLKPETLKGVEVGMRYQVLRDFFDADVFYNTVKDPVTNVTVGLGPATFPTAGFIPAGGTLRERRNFGHINAYGLEMQVRYAVTSFVDLTSSVTVTHARTQVGKRPPEAPDFSGSFGIITRLEPLILSVDAVFDGKTFDDDLNKLPLKASRNVRARMEYVLTAQLAASLEVTNALNDKIQIAHSNDNLLSYDSGRTVWVELSYRR